MIEYKQFDHQSQSPDDLEVGNNEVAEDARTYEESVEQQLSQSGY